MEALWNSGLITGITGSDLTQQHSKLRQPPVCIFEGDSHGSCLRWAGMYPPFTPGRTLEETGPGRHMTSSGLTTFAFVGAVFVLIFWGSLFT